MDYKNIAMRARNLQPSNNLFCEYCYFVKKRITRAIDIDHIDGRWWKNNVDNRLKDPYNLILLCRDCHSHKTRKTKDYSRKIVKYIIDTKVYDKLNNFEYINLEDYKKD